MTLGYQLKDCCLKLIALKNIANLLSS